MIIKKYVSGRFAGIKDVSLEFKDGLNVILGSNESGKSTLVEGIHSVLFKPSKIGRKSAEDKEFHSKFMPYPIGDSIDGEIDLEHNGEIYTLSKEWGADAYSKLTMPNKIVIKSDGSINDTLKNVYIYGEGTYSSVFFLKQYYLKEAINRIVQNKEATGEISSLLRSTIMELDGVPLESLGQKIQDEIDTLFKRWDVERNYPENNKGINNPYKVGFGQVVDSYYAKERIKIDMDKAEDAERKFNEICIHIKNTEEKIEELKNKKESMESLENDVIQRSILEPQIEQLNKDISALSKINQEWPRSDERLKQLTSELTKLNDIYKKLEEEKALSKKVEEKNILEKNLAKVDEINAKLKELNTQISKIKAVTKEDIRTLETNYNGMNRAEAMMKAGVIMAKLNYFPEGKKLTVTKDLEEPAEVNAGDSFSAKGFMKLQSENLIEIEIKSGDIDFNEIRIQYENFKKNYEQLLKTLKAKNLEEAKLNKEKLDRLSRTLDSYNVQKNQYLGDISYEELKDKIKEFGDLSLIRNATIIESDMSAVTTEKIELISEKKLLENKIDKWIEEYTDLDGLFNKTIDIKFKQKEIKTNIDKLAELPSEYSSADEFRKILTQIRSSHGTLINTLASQKEEYYEREKELPESTYEELCESLKQAENLFKKRLEKGKRLLKIQENFENIKLKMDEKSFIPVITAFSNYLNLLTDGSYKATDIDDDFNLKLKNGNDTVMPLSLLSSGTYDCVALALRLAIAEYILGDNKGFLILDDCLVDLDPKRRETAVKLITKFAKKHQVIFTTCSPDTAALLG
ncbi:MAG: AAA family ATPase, partial [Sedimentibacter sp.]